MSRIFGVMLLLAVLTLGPMAHAQTSPPSAVVAEAQRAAQLTGQTLVGPPTDAEVTTDPVTGSNLWEVKWNVVSSPNPGYVKVTVNEQRGKAVAYYSSIGFKTLTASFRAGQSVSLTEAQAVAKLDALMTALPIASGDWRLEAARLAPVAINNGQPGEPIWEVTKRRYHMGKYVSLGYISADVNPYDGTICSWDTYDEGVFLAPSGPLLTTAQVQPAAVNAFTQYAASLLQPGDSTNPEQPVRAEPSWGTLSPDSPLCRLQYVFTFVLTHIEDPNYDPVADGPYNGRPPARIGVVADAETGEIVKVETISGSGSGGRLEAVKFSPRVRLMQSLAKDRAALPLLKAVASGKALKNAKPDAKGQRFTRRVGDKDRAFALNVSARRLTWESEPGKWAGVALTGTQTEEVKQFMAAPPASAPATKK